MFASLLDQGDAGSYMPHGMCYLWEQDLVWIHVVSDALTTLAYWAIPPFLIYLAVKARHEIPTSAPYARKRLPYDWMFAAFGLFIVACGATHAMGIWTIWEPRYWLEGGVKAVTALASLATAVALPPLVPRALKVIREARESELRRVELEEAHQEQRELVDRLRDAHQAQSRFLANVSHDLRTPLSLILGPVDELLEGDPPEEVREQLEIVARGGRTLQGQVENLLSVARTEREGLEAEMKRVDLADLTREVADLYETHARRREIDYRVETPDSLAADTDPDLMKRATLNLLSNAFKFTPDGGTVVLVLRETDDGAVEIVVRDSGPGVPEGERTTVFDRFRQGQSGTGNPEGGTGLGLAIVREVAEAHGGSVRLDGAPEGGARVTLGLPAAVRPATVTDRPSEGEDVRPAEGKADAAEPAGLHPARELQVWSPADRSGDGQEQARATVLVVEDDADMARHLGRILSEDYRVAFAAHGKEGLERAVELKPDLVLTDMMMPVMDGAELIAALRERAGLERVPIIVLTARAEPELPERMLRRGAQDYVIKPIRKGELRARIENLLELSGSRHLLQETLDSREDSLERLAALAARRKEELEGAVRKNEVLLRELHHRVKGNLQTISSLLQLQLRHVEDEEARRSLEESRGRVATMGILHEKLYHSGVHDRVELSGYLRRLVADIVRSKAADAAVHTELALEELEVPVDDAVASGLLVHELVTNALHHAFPSGESGTVRLSLRRDGDAAVLTVADDGSGMASATQDDDSTESLGLELVDSLVRQLEGEIAFQSGSGGGTRVQITFPLSAVPEDDPAATTSTGG